MPPQQLPGHQLIADKFGWLRVRAQPGAAQWSEDDLVCRTPGRPNPGNPAQAHAQASPADGLDAIIRRIDSEPVRPQRGISALKPRAIGMLKTHVES